MPGRQPTSSRHDFPEVRYVPIDSIKQSPENVDLYGQVCQDSQIRLLIESIATHGIREPIIISEDHFIIAGHRIAVTREQIGELNLAADFDPAKESSSRFRSFVEKTGDTKTWECEALPPDFLSVQLRAAIEANMDVDTYHKVVERERKDAKELHALKQRVAAEIEGL